MGLLGLIVKIVGILILAAVGLGAYLYFTDYEASGAITEKGRDGGGDYVVIKPKLIPYSVHQSVDANAARYVCEGYEVFFRVQTKHYRVVDTQGLLVYDSDTGLASVDRLVPCAI